MAMDFGAGAEMLATGMLTTKAGDGAIGFDGGALAGPTSAAWPAAWGMLTT